MSLLNLLVRRRIRIYMMDMAFWHFFCIARESIGPSFETLGWNR